MDVKHIAKWYEIGWNKLGCITKKHQQSYSITHSSHSNYKLHTQGDTDGENLKIKIKWNLSTLQKLWNAWLMRTENI